MNNNPFLTILAVTFEHDFAQLNVFLGSLAAQTVKDWKCMLLHDGAPKNSLEIISLRDKYNAFLGSQKIFVDWTVERENCYGHNLRQLGLETIDTDWVCFQNADNYLTPKFVEIIKTTADNTDSDLIVFNLIHNYACKAFGGPEYGMLDVKLACNHIDMGSFIIKSKLAKDVGFNHRDFAADWYFLQDVINYKKDLKAVKLPNVLMVHN